MLNTVPMIHTSSPLLHWHKSNIIRKLNTNIVACTVQMEKHVIRTINTFYCAKSNFSHIFPHLVSQNAVLSQKKIISQRVAIMWMDLNLVWKKHNTGKWSLMNLHLTPSWGPYHCNIKHWHVHLQWRQLTVRFHIANLQFYKRKQQMVH